MSNRAKRLCSGKYLYRGFVIERVGYMSNDCKVGWEVNDGDGSSFGQSFSLREAKLCVDYEIERLNNYVDKSS